MTIEPPRRGTLIRDHPGLFLSLGSACFIALRILAVSRFDVATAAIVLQEQGTPAVIVGSLLPALATLPMVVAMLVTLYVTPRNLGSSQHLRWLLGAIVFGHLTLLFLPPALATALLAYTLVASVLMASILLIRGRRKERKPAGFDPHNRRMNRQIKQRALRRGQFIWAAVAIGPLGAVVALSPTPWLPPEFIETASESAGVVGYVLGTSGDEYVILQEDPFTVTRVSDAASRRYCKKAPGNHWPKALKGFNANKTVLGALIGSPELPSCDALQKSSSGSGHPVIAPSGHPVARRALP